MLFKNEIKDETEYLFRSDFSGSHKTFDVDGSALSIPRSTAEVLKIVYGGGSHSGGVYPKRLNGSIK